VVQLLLETGADADAKDGYGQTLLSRAAEGGHEAIVQMLLKKNISPNSTDNIKRTPLSYAAKNGDNRVVVALLTDKRVDIDPKDHYGSTPLSIAARNGHIDVVKLLLDTRHVDINSRDCFGRTPLWYARRYGSANIVQLLLENAENRDILVCENDVPVEVGLRSNDGRSRYCDICTLGIHKDDVYYRCGVCNNGDFDICSECYKVGGRCFEVDHELLQKERSATSDSESEASELETSESEED
jgi:ankyrin repeat protein